jgi:superfamily II DNA or RNA helicase
MRLVSSRVIDKPEVVYNLHVADNNNYVANNIVVSNCQGAKGSVIADLIRQSGGKIPFRFGVTGTLPKDLLDQLSIKISLGATRCVVPAHELMAAGLLSTIDITMIELEENLNDEYKAYLDEGGREAYKKFKAEFLPEYASEKKYLIKHEKRLRFLASQLLSQRDKYGNVLCLVGSIPVARALAALIPGAICVNGVDMGSAKLRKEHYDLFDQRDDVIMIATTHIAGVGLSIDRIFCLTLIDLGKSFIKTIQTIGRGLRMADDKRHIRVFDYYSDLKYSKLHVKSRVSYYKEAQYKFKRLSIDYTKYRDDILIDE